MVIVARCFSAGRTAAPVGGEEHTAAGRREVYHGVILGGGRKAASAVKLRREAIINHASTEGRRMDAKLEDELRALVADTVGLDVRRDAVCWTPERKLLVRARLARRLSRAFGRVVAPDDITIRPPRDGVVDVAVPCLSSPAVALLDLRAHLRLPAGKADPALW